MITRIILSVGVGFFALGPASVAAQHFPASANLTAFIRSQVEEGRAGGIVVGVIEADGSTRVVSLGSAGPSRRPLGARSVFEIGSITKVFTATLLADMIARGEVSLSDPVAKYLPDEVSMPVRGSRQITLLDLVTHHSGLPRVPDNMPRSNRLNPFEDYSVERLYAFLSAYELRRDIGADFEYSNLGVGLLGHALGRAKGMSYEALVRERVLEPLGMSMTGVTLEEESSDWMSDGHDGAGNVVPLWQMSVLEGAGALRSTAEDMLGFLAANMGPPTSSLARSMRVTHEIQKQIDSRRGIGLAWRVERVGDGTMLFHTGGTAGFQSFIGFDPDKRVGTVVLTNANPADSIQLAGAIGRQLIYPEPPATPEFETAESVLRRYIGTYEVRPGRFISVTLENGALFAQPTGARRASLVAVSEARFSLNGTEVYVSFTTDESGTVTGLVVHQNGTDTPARRVSRTHDSTRTRFSPLRGGARRLR
jgi:CubicO group peptidase (beta-lactamase class C family)